MHWLQSVSSSLSSSLKSPYKPSKLPDDELSPLPELLELSIGSPPSPTISHVSPATGALLLLVMFSPLRTGKAKVLAAAPGPNGEGGVLVGMLNTGTKGSLGAAAHWRDKPDGLGCAGGRGCNEPLSVLLLLALLKGECSSTAKCPAPPSQLLAENGVPLPSLDRALHGSNLGVVLAPNPAKLTRRLRVCPWGLSYVLVRALLGLLLLPARPADVVCRRLSSRPRMWIRWSKTLDWTKARRRGQLPAEV